MEKIINFFNDLEIQGSNINNIKYYSNILNDIDNQFNSTYNIIKEKSESKINSYGENNIKNIVSNSGINNFKNIFDKYSQLKLKLLNINNSLTNQLKNLNQQISDIERKIQISEIKLYSIKNSENASQGNLIDDKNKNFIIIYESITILILSGIFLKVLNNFRNY